MSLDKPTTPLNQQQDKKLSGPEGVKMLADALAQVPGVSFAEFLQSLKGQESLKTKKIIVAGAPQSGKSVLRELIKRAVRAIPNSPYPYFVTAAPDGEWAGFQQSVALDPDLARKMKTDYKTAIKEGGSMFTPAYVQRISEGVKNLSAPHNPLNFIDIGGKLSVENYEICSGANGAIILCSERATKVAGGVGTMEDAAKEEMDPREWKKFFTTLGIPVIAVIYSDYSGTEDTVTDVGADGAFYGSVHYLERGQLDAEKRPAVQALAQHIVGDGLEKAVHDRALVDFSEKLKSSGVDTSQWGTGSAKTIEALWKEIEEGETELVAGADGKLARKIAVANIEVFGTDPSTGKKIRLVERRQVFSDGRERVRTLGTTVAEKLKVGEDVPAAAVRGVQEELGIENSLNLAPMGTETKEGESESYPGLATRYEIHKFSVELSGDQYKPEGYTEKQDDKTTYFEWEETV